MNNLNRVRSYNPDFVVLPGVTLKETLESIGMTQVELAKRMGRPEKTISEIINGATVITSETAIQLERVLGISASFWNNLEKNYQEQKAKLAALETLKEEYELAKKYPYSHMCKLGWVKQAQSIHDKVQNLITFFRVSSLKYVCDIHNVSFRQHKGKDISIESVQAWLRQGEIDSIHIDTAEFNPIKLKSLVSELRSLTKIDPEDFVPLLKMKLASVGVVLLFTPGLPKTYVCGASRWLNSKKALIQLSLRGKSADIMWFTLFHEIGHVLLHNKRTIYVDLDMKDNNSIEAEADHFASESLIPSERYQRFISGNPINSITIRNFAEEIGIHPGLVVGRLQHEGIVDFSRFVNLKIKYVFKHLSE